MTPKHTPLDRRQLCAIYLRVAGVRHCRAVARRHGFQAPLVVWLWGFVLMLRERL